MKAIEFDSVTKTFPDGTVAVDKLSLGVENGETMALIGPSGCGKTTTLRLLAGLEDPTAGSIWLGESDVTRVAPANRNVAMMFQSDALYSHMSVRGNLSFGLKNRRRFWSRAFRSGSVDANSSPERIVEGIGSVAKRLGIEPLLDRKPHQLSGGERQRVALGRAMIRDPAAFLLDEPLSRLDARLAGELRIELRQVFRDLGKPVLYVTHDQREAMALADRLAVMDRGKVLQVGEPLEVYQRPVNLFVANFVGSVPVNVLPKALLASMLAPAGAEIFGFRAEHVGVSGKQEGAGGALSFRARVREVERLGDHALVYMDADELEGARLVARCDAETEFRPGDPIKASVDEERLMWFDASQQRIKSVAE
ncbi:ABC transporter ATP-binding protein [Mariniblastus fucicola]|uniref:Trehalose import ATP-binding protein SugC n=1 Tax=Mariniblastus fucicola TaxID=980251 RepID=A0A5B9P6N4_9BACT|nr:ABC transporter ATP-binding protein [Mariniblastus fucicola]QEG20316.1 Trehalose import ATP-binding protein SugC [Mariniblastus fucicola]